ncbi:MAG: hypothetical protein LC623_00085, partial [Halobacteriales archaeon]|nr:hypothetical protein [Halobacteriales archaeon]
MIARQVRAHRPKRPNPGKQAKENADKTSASPFHVLLVEDEPDQMALFRKAFHAVAPGVRITELDDCSHVVALLWKALASGRDLPDLVLMDLMMRGVSCHDVLAAIKTDPLV